MLFDTDRFYNPFQDFDSIFGRRRHHGDVYRPRGLNNDLFDVRSGFPQRRRQNRYQRSTDDAAEEVSWVDKAETRRKTPTETSRKTNDEGIKKRVRKAATTESSRREEKPQDYQKPDGRLDEINDINSAAVADENIEKVGHEAFEIPTETHSGGSQANEKITSCKLPKEEREFLEEDHAETDEINKDMGVNSSAIKSEKLKLINEICAEVEVYSKQVDQLTDKEKEKHFVFLEEMLTKCLLKLDNISTDGFEEVRKSRKEIVEKINAKLQIIEEKLEIRQNGNFPEETVDNSADKSLTILDNIRKENQK